VASSPYITPERARELIGAEALRIAAPDGGAKDGIDSAQLRAACATANSRIDAEIQIRYSVPLDAGDIPDWLTQSAAYLVHELLCADDGARTELIGERAERARKDVRMVADGGAKLGSGAADDASARRTEAGRAHLVKGNDRAFRRGDTAGVI